MDDSGIHVLLIEDNPTDVLLIRQAVAAVPRVPYAFTHAERLGEGLKRLSAEAFDVVLVDLSVGELPSCQADPTLLRQALMNLVSNALKFTRQREVARIEVGYQTIHGEHVYYVRDSGVGFDMQYAPKLFGVFERLHREEDYEGNGIGLALAQRIIQRHGGRIWAEAAVDRGATFYFTL